MESIEGIRSNLSDRFILFQDWIKNVCALSQAKLQPLAHDASFRRYYRVYNRDKPYIAMDAPPIHGGCERFIAIAQLLRSHDLEAPEVIHQDLAQGFLLLSDFGNDTFLSILNNKNADQLYQLALEQLYKLKDCHTETIILPKFDFHFMLEEWAWHKDWFINQFMCCNVPINLDAAYHLLAESIDQQPKVFMHRDYHSANLMFFDNKVGILDFQDAFQGPVSYDCVSLLRDCYIAWPEQAVQKWLKYYFDLLITQSEFQQLTFADFLHWFDWMAIQRHMKALLTFARKYIRDQDRRYLKHMLRTIDYIINESKAYSLLQPIHDFYRNIRTPLNEKVAILCAQ